MANVQELATLPTFNGQTSSDGKQMSAESFLARMTNYVQAIPGNPPDDFKIAKVAAQFRGRAAQWWNLRCVDPEIPSNIIKQRAQDEWDYFVTCFKQRFFQVVDSADTVEDISDLKQESHERIEDYVERLDNTIQVVNSIVKRDQYTLTNNWDWDARRPGQVNAIINALPAANQADARAVIDAYAQAVAREATRAAVDRISFMQVARAAGRGAREPWARVTAKRAMQDPERRTDDLIALLRTEALTHKPIPNQVPKQAVNALDQAIGDDQDDSDQDDEDAADVDAIAKGAKKKKKGKQPQGSKSTGKDKPKRKGAYCEFCRRQGHATSECNNLKKHHEKYDAWKKTNRPQRRPNVSWQASNGAGQNGGEMMDTSSASNAMQQLSIHQQYANPPPPAAEVPNYFMQSGNY